MLLLKKRIISNKLIIFLMMVPIPTLSLTPLPNLTAISPPSSQTLKPKISLLLRITNSCTIPHLGSPNSRSSLKSTKTQFHTDPWWMLTSASTTFWLNSYSTFFAPFLTVYPIICPTPLLSNRTSSLCRITHSLSILCIAQTSYLFTPQYLPTLPSIPCFPLTKSKTSRTSLIPL